MPITSRQQTAIALGCALSVTLLGSGCSSLSNAFSGDKIDYRSSGSQSVRLDVPPDLSQLSGQSRFSQVSPSIVTASSMGQSSQATANATSNQVAAKAVGDIRMERQGQTRWLVVNQAPEQVYEKVRAFWSSVGFELVIDQPAAGLMETNWNENRAKLNEGGVRGLLGSVLERLYDTGERDQFRTRLERTAQGTEVYVTHRGMEEVFEGDRKERTTWRGRPSDANLEAEMLARMMVALGATKEQAERTREEAGKPATTPAANAVVATLNADATSLTLRGEPDLAWRRVGLALDRGGFTVEGRDRASSTYEVRLSVNDPAAAQPGFFSRLFGRGKKEETLARYRVKVQPQGRDTLISVLSEAGQAVDNDTTRLIAKRLVDELN
jgi:outer membrane protein assembly factor BamC